MSALLAVLGSTLLVRAEIRPDRQGDTLPPPWEDRAGFTIAAVLAADRAEAVALLPLELRPRLLAPWAG